eukprot:TRINITY_DN83328_c0_g1_i1.p1 TRINITY_DN83328_c0_g1~~TRINITY_DN83328_c0_g1_i1.p1  ORF type:complete len:479 (+),score=114.53 TRINITY_DN83328_c0_g1_i1:111-1547(+)
MSSMQRWKGDYTLPRFRAKLAEKYGKDPNVEPDYEEVYRPELGERIVLRKDSRYSSYGSTATGGLSSSSSAGTLRSLQGVSTFAGSRSSWSSMSGSKALPSLKREFSAPSLGVKRHEVAPARLTRDHFSASAPQLSPADEKEKAASKQLWMAVNGSEMSIKLHAAQMDIDKKNGQVPVPIAKMALPGSMKNAMKNGAKLDWRNDDWDGATLLIKAVRTGQMEVASWCLGSGADSSLTDKSGRGILHWAALEGNAAMMEFVLTEAPDLSPSQADAGGDQPIHLAAFAGNLPVVRLLVQAQADPLVTNGGGYSALDLAKAKRQWHVARYLNEFRQLEDDRVKGVLEKGVQKFPGEAERVKQITQTLNSGEAGSKSRFERTEREVRDLLAAREEEGLLEDPLKLQKLASLQRNANTLRQKQLKALVVDPFEPPPVEDPEREHLVGIRQEVQEDLQQLAYDLAETPEIKKLREAQAAALGGK